MKNITFICLALFCLISYSQEIFAQTLHAILVVDTVHEISHVTRTDLERWQKELRSIAQHTQLNLNEKIFSGDNFNKNKTAAYLKDLKVNDSDAMLFYFSGHGYRTFQKKTRWPFLTFEYYKQGLDIQWIIQTIRDKNPRFALIMSDCCNNFMENGLFGNETKNVMVNLNQVSPQFSGYTHLFCHAKGCIVISSCSEGQFSYGSCFGGLYTQCFFNSLYHELQEASPSWKHLIQRANGVIRKIQRPMCEIYR